MGIWEVEEQCLQGDSSLSPSIALAILPGRHSFSEHTVCTLKDYMSSFEVYYFWITIMIRETGT